MKRFMFILLAAAMSIGLYAQAGNIVKGIAGGATITLINNKAQSAADRAVREQLKKLKLTPSPVVNQPVKLKSETLNLDKTMKRHGSWSFAVDTNIVTFRFFTDSIAICENPDGTPSRLKQLPAHQQAKDGERVYRGKTFIGDGVYIFDKNFSYLRFYNAAQPASTPRIYPHR